MRVLAVTASNPAVHVRFFLLAFGALGRKSQRAQKGELCAATPAEVASLEVGRGSLIFRLFRRVFCGLKFSAAAGVKKMDYGHVADACFGITGARNRPTPTLLPSETCTQTPLDRPKMFFPPRPRFCRRALSRPRWRFSSLFRHSVCFFRIFDRQLVGLDLKHRLRTSIGCETWLRSRVASRPKGTFLALKRALMGNSA